VRGRSHEVEVEVELVAEVGPEPSGPGEDSRPAAGVVAAEATVRPSRWARRRWWLASGALALALVLVVPSVVSGARERSHLAALAGIPGLIAPVDGPVGELWSTGDLGLTGGYVNGPTDMHVVGGVLVSTFWSAADGLAIRGVDVGTGHDVWSSTLAGPQSGGGQCAFAEGPVDGPRQAVWACVVVDEATEVPIKDVGAWRRPTKVHLSALDPRTGRVLGQYPVEATDVISGFGTDIVVASMGDQGIDVRRLDPRTGSTVWVSHHPSPSRTGGAPLSFEAAGDDLLAKSGTQGWVLSASGEVRDQWDGLSPDSDWDWRRTPGGHVLRTTYVSSNAVTVTDLAGGTTITTTEAGAVPPVLDDGSAPDLLITGGPDLTAWDLGTGDQRWQTDGAVSSFIVLEGVVYSVGDGHVRAQDAATGTVRWTVQSAAPSGGSLATDGRSLLVLGLDTGGSGSTLRALDLADGGKAWQSHVTPASGHLLGVATHLFVWSDDGSIVALG
jgi:outer membrane protein assembly factor BamB